MLASFCVNCPSSLSGSSEFLAGSFFASVSFGSKLQPIKSESVIEVVVSVELVSVSSLGGVVTFGVSFNGYLLCSAYDGF